MNAHKSTPKASTPVGRSRPQLQAVRPPSPKVDGAAVRRPAASSPGPKIPTSARATSRKSPSTFSDFERVKGKGGADDGQLSDQVLLSLSRHERCDTFSNEQQSILGRSVCGDTVLQEMVEKQKASQRLSSKASFVEATTPPCNSPSFAAGVAAPALGRDVTESTALSALTEELTLESDDGTSSDRTHPAAYFGQPSVPRPRDTADLLKHMSDAEFSNLLSLINSENDRRAGMQHTPSSHGTTYAGCEINFSALESRKNVRRSRSGGSDSAFYHSSKLLTPNKGSSKSHARTMSVDIEDAELSNAFNAAGLTPGAASRAASRGSGAHQVLDKMCTRPYGLSCVTPPFDTSPQVTSNPNSLSSVLGVASPHGASQLNNSPLDFASQSQPSSRPASRLSGMIHLQALLPQEAANASNVPVPIARKVAQKRGVVSSTATVEHMVGGVMSIDEFSHTDGMERQESEGSVMSNTRDLMLSPFSAFDDFSVGSQSINSNRSSKARRKLDQLDASPPVVTGKHMDGRHKVPTIHSSFHANSGHGKPSKGSGEKKSSAKK